MKFRRSYQKRFVGWHVRLCRTLYGRRGGALKNHSRPDPESFRTGAVIVSRNDNYGGNLAERAACALRSAALSFDKVIYVDWASEGRSLVSEIRPQLDGLDNLYQVEVSVEEARRLTGAAPGVQACCEVLARNIGIRRLLEQGFDYIVSSNIDIIFPGRERIQNFVLNHVSPGSLVTVSRRDVPLSDVQGTGSDDPLVWSQVLETQKDRYKQQERNSDPRPSLIGCCGDFQVAGSSVWQCIRGFEERLVYAMETDTGLQCKAFAAGLDVKVDFDLPIFHIDHNTGNGGGGRRNNMLELMPILRITGNPTDWGQIKNPRLHEMQV